MSMRDFMGREPIKLEDIDLSPFRGQEQFLDDPGDELAARIDAADAFLEATACQVWDSCFPGIVPKYSAAFRLGLSARLSKNPKLCP